MAYSDIALLAVDWDFINRTAGAIAAEQIDLGELNASGWASSHAWEMAGQPGFGDKYGFAVANGVARPGNDQSVISDGEILSAVQALIAAEPA